MRLMNSAPLRYEILSQRVMLAGDLSAIVPDAIGPDLGSQLVQSETTSTDVETTVKIEIPPARIVINDTIGPAGSREYAEPFDAVVHLQLGCTGTLIAPDVVLTARHCESAPGDTINFGDNSNAPIFTATVASVFAPAGNGTLLDGGDVEILTLTSAVPASIATPMRLIDATDSLEGQLVATVGYGLNGIGSQGHQFTSDGFRWGGENIIDSYGSPADSTGANIISTDFDDGSAAANTIAGGDATPLELEATTAPGDSGGPVLVRSGSEWVIAGVLSGGTNSTSVYGDISWWTGTAIWRADIESFGGVFISSDLGDVRLDAPSYTEVGTINLSVGDNNATGPVTVTINVSSGDSEVLTLTDSGSGTYSGSINSVVLPGTLGDGLLQVADDDVITVTYLDTDDGNGAAITVTDTAVVFRDDFGDDVATATAIGFPLTLSGEIEQAVDQDWFSFDAVLGMQYDFATALGSLSGTTLTLYDSSGTTSLQTSGGAISWRPSVAGEYFIVVESSSSGLGTYELTGTESVPQSTVEFAASSLPDNGQVAVTVFEPNSNSPVIVSIEASSGDIETLSLAANGDMEFTSVINLVAGPANAGDGTLQVSQGDTVTVTYIDPDNGLGGISTTTDTATIISDDHGGSSDTATSVATPFNVPGELEQTSDEDWFSFTAVEGFEYEFETTLNTLSDSTLRLYDTNGTTQLVFNDDGGAGLASLINWQAPASGVYFLSVQAFSTTQTGTYELTGLENDQIIVIEDDHGSSSSTATPVDAPFSVSGELEQNLDEDWFSFTAVQGDEYEFETTLNTLSDSTLRLYDTNGTTQLTFNDDGGAGLASLINWQAPANGVYFLSVQAFSTTQTGTYELTGTVSEAEPGVIVGRHLFYDGSSFDGDAGVHSVNDDVAIAANKTPLQTGTAALENYTNFENGITGLFIDIDGLGNSPQPGDFEFRVGNSNFPSSWPLLAVAPDISVRFGSGDLGSDRVSLIWPAGTIVDQWLQVSVLADGPGGIVGDTDVHYWGNQRGDTGNSTANTTVNSGDLSNVIAHFSGFGLVDPTSDFDLNKDGRVNSGDVSVVSSRLSGFVPTLQLITAVDRAQPNSDEDTSKQKPMPKTIESDKVVEVVKGTDDYADAQEGLDAGRQQESSAPASFNEAAGRDEVRAIQPNVTSVSPTSNFEVSNEENVVAADAPQALAKSEPDRFLQPSNQLPAVSSGEASVNLPSLGFVEPASNFTIKDAQQAIGGNESLILSAASRFTNALPVFNQPTGATSVQHESLGIASFLTHGTQPVKNTDLMMRRLDRIDRSIDRLESKDELTKRQQRRLGNLKAREVGILDAIDQRNEKIEFTDSIDHSLVDAAFATLAITDFQFDS